MQPMKFFRSIVHALHYPTVLRFTVWGHSDETRGATASLATLVTGDQTLRVIVIGTDL
jgi:hypothetical protein